MSNLGITVVTHNSAGYVARCLDACLEHCRSLQPQIVVVDNASTDETLAEVSARKEVVLVANPDNRGFAAAVNQGFRVLAGCDAVLVLNPDTHLQTPLEPMLNELHQPGVGACGGSLVSTDGRLEIGFQVRRFPTSVALVFETLGVNRLWPGNPVNRKYRCLDLDPLQPADVEQPAGAFLLVRRSAWEEVGGLDEGFGPVWFEDVDFLYRISRAGYRIRYVPSARTEHAGGHSVRRMEWGHRQVVWYATLLRYAALHFTFLGRTMVAFSVVVGAGWRAAIRFLQTRSAGPLSVYARVVRLSAGVVLSGSDSPMITPVGGAGMSGGCSG